MNGVYTNPPTTESNELTAARAHLNVARGSGDWHTVKYSLQMASANTLISIAETLAALLPATQEIAGALVGAYSPDAGALAVVDANAAV